MNNIAFYVDEHLSVPVIERLRNHGMDVLTVDDAGRRTDPDDAQLRFATAQSRTIVTFDRDYLRLDGEFRMRNEPHCGIIYCDPDRYQYFPTRLGDDLLILHGAMNREELFSRVEYLK